MDYTIPKPTIPTWTRCSVVIVFGGVIALGVIAFLTFRLFNMPVIPAALLAGVIEYSTFTAGVNLIRGNKLTWPEIIIGLIGSSVVNFIHFQAANNEAVTKVTSPVLLGILAVFPLLVIFSSSLWIGKEIAEHGAKVKAWEDGRAAWMQEQAAKSEAARTAAQERERADRAEAHRLEVEAQERVQLAQIQADADARARADRAEARRLARLEKAAAQPAQVPAQAAVQTAQPTQRGAYEDFRLAQLARNGAGPMDFKQVMERFNVSRRTAYTWLEKYQAEHAQPVVMNAN